MGFVREQGVVGLAVGFILGSAKGLQTANDILLLTNSEFLINSRPIEYYAKF